MVLDFSGESLQQDVPLEPRNSVSVYDAIADFKAQAEAYGLNIQSLDTSGAIVRVTTQSKPNKRNGWYSFEELHPGFFVGHYGDWRESDSGMSWRSWTESGVSDEERKFLREQAAKREQERKESAKREQVEKAEKITAHFQSLPPCQKHQYATNKHIGLYGDVRLDDRGALTVPLVWTDGSIVGMQKIYPDGEKRTHGVIDRTDVRPFGQILGEHDHIYIVEGYATAASVHEATGKTVVVALYANRLKAIGQVIREKLPKTPITFVADNDVDLTPNKGVKFAREAADAIGADVVVPDIGNESLDANDVAVKYGMEMLKTLLSVDGKSIYGISSMREIVEREYPHNPVIEGLLDEGECMLLVGDSNLGKSIITLHIAAMCGNPELDNPTWANGVMDFSGPPMLFGHFPILSRSLSLFLQDENSGKNLQKRMRSMCDANEKIKLAYESDAMFSVTIGDDKNPCATGTLMDEALFKALKVNILKERIRLLIVDPLSSYHGAVDENSNVEMLDALNKTFRRLSRDTGCAVIVVHHTGKDGSGRGGRGASSIKGWADSQLIGEEVETDDDGKVIRFKYDKARSFERIPTEFYLRMTKQLDFELIEDYEPPSDAKETKWADATDVVAVINMNDGTIEGKAKLTQLVADYANTSKASSKKAIDKACASGLVQEESRGAMKAVIYTI